MKIKSIAAICKKGKSICLVDRPSKGERVEQWIGDGNSLYPLTGLPYMDESGIMTIFDIPEKQRDTYTWRHITEPNGISFEDIVSDERMLDSEKMGIVDDGRVLKPLQTSKGLVFIETKFLSPLADVYDVMELYERTTPAGEIIIAAKVGLLLYALIMPYNVIRETFVEQLIGLARQCRLALQLKEAEKTRRAAEVPTQGSLPVDPLTGEVLT